MFFLSLDEIDRVKRVNGIQSLVEMERVTGVTRKTWQKAIQTREPKPAVLQALSNLGARASKVLVTEEFVKQSAA